MAEFVPASQYPPLLMADTIPKEKAAEICKMARFVRFACGGKAGIDWERMYVAIYAAGFAAGKTERT